MSVAEWVSLEVMHVGGFNYYEPSLFFSVENKSYQAHIATPFVWTQAQQKALIIIEDRTDLQWYFRELGLPGGDDHIEYVNQEAQRTVNDQFRVEARDLEKLVLKAMDKL